jgi:hypothetical protein
MARILQERGVMNTFHTMIAISSASAALLVLGCEHADDRYVATATPAPVQTREPLGATNSQPRSSYADASVVDRISSARCDREQSCNNVGDGKKYASRGVCMDQLHGAVANDLNSYQCPRGIDGPAVQECVSAIVGEECGAHPVEAITRIEKCRTGAMCMK